MWYFQVRVLRFISSYAENDKKQLSSSGITLIIFIAFKFFLVAGTNLVFCFYYY